MCFYFSAGTIVLLFFSHLLSCTQDKLTHHYCYVYNCIFVLPTSEAGKEAHSLRQYIRYVYVCYVGI